MELQSVVDPKTATSAIELQDASERDQAAQTSTSSQEQARAEEESGSAADEKSENVHGPTGIRFALLFTCLLLGNFFVGYVRVELSQESEGERERQS